MVLLNHPVEFAGEIGVFNFLLSHFSLCTLHNCTCIKANGKNNNKEEENAGKCKS